MRGGLVGHHIRKKPAGHQVRQQLGGVAEHANRAGDAVAGALLRAPHRSVQVRRTFVEVLRGQPLFNPGRIDLDDQRHAAVHGHGQRLGATHATQTGGDDDAAGQRAAKMPAGQRG